LFIDKNRNTVQTEIHFRKFPQQISPHNSFSILEPVCSTVKKIRRTAGKIEAQPAKIRQAVPKILEKLQFQLQKRWFPMTTISGRLQIHALVAVSGLK
jgi:hypothetical protein